MSHRIFSKQSVEGSITKMTTLITNKSSRGPISTEDVFFHELNQNLVVIGHSS